MTTSIEQYSALLHRYDRTLDLMSENALRSLETKLAEAQSYADFLLPRLAPTDRILDVGSGAGLPGLLLALTLPQHQVTWVEQRQRRGNFLRIVASQLHLDNVEVAVSNVRRFRGGPYRWVTAQAVGSLPLLYCLTRHLHTPTVTLVTRRQALSPTELVELEGLTGPLESTESVPLETHGKLVAVQVQGGQPCPSSG